MKLLGNTIINKEERKKQSTEKKYILNRDSECEYDGNRSEQVHILIIYKLPYLTKFAVTLETLKKGCNFF